MRAVVQRVKNAKVTVDGKVTGKINKGLLIYLGVEVEDSEEDLVYTLDKILNLRIFEDENDKMNLSLMDISGDILAVSQFTLYGDCRRGRRPSFTNAARPEKAENLYNKFIKGIKEKGVHVETGIFGAQMDVESINDGPVTILLDSGKAF